MMSGLSRSIGPALAIAVSLLSAGPVRAQVGIYSPFYGNYLNPMGEFGYGGFGYGGLGYGAGYGSYGGYSGFGGIGATIGMYPWDQEMIKEQTYELNASQQNLMNAQAAQAYQASNLLRQQAISQARSNYAPASPYSGSYSPGYTPRYNIATAATRPYPTRGGARARGRANPNLLPPAQVLADDGTIRWPSSTPKGPELDPMREAVDTSFRDLVADHKRNSRAAIRDAVGARDKLYAFGNLALEKLRADKRDADIPETQLFLNSLDNALLALSDAAPRAAMSARIRPDNEPASAGDVLKDTIRRDRPADSPSTSPGDTAPGTTPRSGADVLRDAVGRDRPADSNPPRQAAPTTPPPPPTPAPAPVAPVTNP